MRQHFLKQISIAALFATVITAVGGRADEIPGTIPNTGAQAAAVRSERGKSVPPVLESALTQVKSKSRVPVLLPSTLLHDIGTVRHAVVDKATSGEYQISLHYKLGIGDAGFAGMFVAQADPGYSPQELPNVRVVDLAQGIHGFFRAVSCGGSCAPANLWWTEGHTLYQIQLVLPSYFRARDQEQPLVRMADSAILAGPR
jgi:hypothetical protein